MEGTARTALLARISAAAAAVSVAMPQLELDGAPHSPPSTYLAYTRAT